MPKQDLFERLLPFRGAKYTSGNGVSGFGFRRKLATKPERQLIFFHMHGLLDFFDSMVATMRSKWHFPGNQQVNLPIKIAKLVCTVQWGVDLLSDFVDHGSLQQQQQLAFTRCLVMRSIVDCLKDYPDLIRQPRVQIEVQRLKRVQCPLSLRRYLEDLRFL